MLHRLRTIALIFLLGCCAAPARALEPNQLVLVVNKRVPQGRELAEYYAAQRRVPADHIVELDLPEGEELSFDLYERKVVPALREFLIRRGLHTQVTCLVTFYGVPIRVAAREPAPGDAEERKILQMELKEVERRVEPLVISAEQLAEEVDSGFRRLRGGDFGQLVQRLEHATRFLGQRVPALPDQVQRERVQRQLTELAMQFTQPMSPPAASTGPATAPALTSPAEGVESILSSPQWRRYDSAGRAAVREAGRSSVGLLDYGRLLEVQVGYLTAKDSHAAVDSELSLLWWNLYPRPQWQLNPLHFRVGQVRTSPVLMVMRLDAAAPDVVRRIIDHSIATEQQGLQGCVLLDSWNKPARVGGKEDGYGQYDQTIRDLAVLLREKTQLQVVFDEKESLIELPPDELVAIYCGWYAPSSYSQPGVFAPGAVGFHIASFTMVTLHKQRGGDWVRSLLNDGVVATAGPVAEPYLHAFPRADEFFPLLMTGQLPLAEVVWKTNPLTSWQMSYIGDPLYTPYKLNPPLKRADLPEPLQAALP